jgi:hypothetical protein
MAHPSASSSGDALPATAAAAPNPSPRWLPRLRAAIFGNASHVWAVLDADHCPQLLPMLQRTGAEHVCLLGPHISPAEARRAPHLVRVDVAGELADWLLSGWGLALGIYALSRAPLRVLREHFRSFLVVEDPAGQPLFFRYYDPRVLGVYLPTLNAAEAATVFGPVQAYVIEEENTGAALRFSAPGGTVRIERIADGP